MTIIVVFLTALLYVLVYLVLRYTKGMTLLKPRPMSQIAGVQEAVCAFYRHQCVSAIRAVEMPVLFCLFNSCDHATEIGL